MRARRSAVEGVVSYVDDHEDLGPLHPRALVDLHRRVRDGLHLRALRVPADRELLAVRGRLNFKPLPVELGDLDFLVDRQVRRLESRG